MDLLNMLNFNDYIQVNRLDYDMEYVRKNFYKVQGILGEENKDDTIAAITIRLKNKVIDRATGEEVKTDWIIANSVANTLQLLISKKFLGRKSRYVKLPYVSAIESSKGWDKEHIHALIRLSSLKEEYNANNIESIIREVCLSLDEVNNHIPDSVMVRTFPYLENQYKVVGNSIHYLCKSSTKHYNPLIRTLKNGTTINA